MGVQFSIIQELHCFSVHESMDICFANDLEIIALWSYDDGSAAAEDNCNQVTLHCLILIATKDVIRAPTYVSALGGHQSAFLTSTVNARVRFGGVVFGSTLRYVIGEKVIELMLSEPEVFVCSAPALISEVVPSLCRKPVPT